MHKEEAQRIIAAELAKFRAQPYENLANIIDKPICYETSGPTGLIYQIEIQAFWDDKPQGNMRVMGSIDDGGIRAFFPLSLDFIKSPPDEFR
jgi:hypothetical protein